jgi:hypothetical protein
MRKSYTYGVLPPFADFEHAFKTTCRNSFDWRLQGYDADVMLGFGFYSRLEWFKAEDFYADLQKMIDTDHDRVLDIASSVLDVMGFEWV